MRRPILAGNWKMHKTPAETCAFFEEFRPLVAASKHSEIVIFPPFVDLKAAVEATSGTAIEIGGQNMCWADEGAFTGEISGPMLGTLGCRWVLIAHSERRLYFGETNETAARKIPAALEAGLTPIYCVGENLEQRQAGTIEGCLHEQLLGGLGKLSTQDFGRIVIAYEPIWAIGTGRVATPEIASDAHCLIRDQARRKFGDDAAAACRILYGGSVKPDNIAGLMAQPEIDGALVGGASLDPVAFASIVNF
jgi:triosephosphate isomerase